MRAHHVVDQLENVLVAHEHEPRRRDGLEELGVHSSEQSEHSVLIDDLGSDLQNAPRVVAMPGLSLDHLERVGEQRGDEAVRGQLNELETTEDDDVAHIYPAEELLYLFLLPQALP